MNANETHPRNFSPLGWQIRDRVESDMREPTKDEAIDYLCIDAPNALCFSPWGNYAKDCAPVAYRVTEIISDQTGEPITFDDLDYAMGQVVNGSDDVVRLLAEYGE